MGTQFRARVFAFQLIVTIATVLLIVVVALTHLWGFTESVDATGSALQKEAVENGWQLPPGAIPVLGMAVVLDNLVALLGAGLILALVWVAGERPEARALSLFIFFWFGNLGSLEVYPDEIANDIPHLAVCLAIAALLRFAALFPRRLTEGDLFLDRPPGKRSALAGLVSTLRFSVGRLLLRPFWVWGWAGVASLLLFLSSLAGHRELGAIATVGFVVVGSLQALTFFRLGYAHGDGDGRRRLLWIFNAVLVTAAGIVLIVIVGIPLVVWGTLAWQLDLGVFFYPVGALWGLAIMLFLAVAVFRDGGIDPRLVIRRTAAYGLVAVAMVFLFGAVQSTAVSLLGTWMNSPASALWISGGMVALAFMPVRSWCATRVDRYIEDRLPPTELAQGPSTLATIVFSDLVGYTRLSAENERAALTLVTVFHQAARRAANRHRGRLVKTIGDAVLLSFGGPPLAVAGIFDFQQSLLTVSKALELPEPRLRTGLHHGPVAVARDGDVYGATVNLASRLQSSGQPGQIVASREVVEDEKVRQGFAIEFQDSAELKNVPGLVDRFCISRLPDGDRHRSRL